MTTIALVIYLFGAACVAFLSHRWEDALIWPLIVGVALWKRFLEKLREGE